MEIQKFENVNCEFRLLRGVPPSTTKTATTEKIKVEELAVLFATIILVLSITLLLLKR